MNSAASTPSVWEQPRFWAPATALSCGVLFAIASLFPQFYVLGWLIFVPYLLGLQRCRSVLQAYGYGLLAGLFAYGFSTYWMGEFIHLYKGYSSLASMSLASIYWLFCAQQFALIAVLTHYGRRGNAVLWVFPTALTLVLAFYPAPFPWQIGETQSEFLVAIQATELTGVSGLDFVLAVVAVLIAQALIGRNIFFQRSAVAAYALVAVWFAYGFWSLTHWDNATARWPTFKVGMVQPDEPPSIETPGPRPGFSLAYPVEMDLTEQLVKAGAQLVIWPELRNKQYYTRPFVQAAYRRQVANLGRPLLLQSLKQTEGRNFNTSFLIDETGHERGQYQKIKRIALAEYLPLFEHSEVAKDWARQTLGEFFGDYVAGSEPKRFDIGATSITPLICYEVMFTQFVAASTATARGDILVAQSNNGWFGDTRIPYPHMSASILRSVENRRPMVHVMNNGLGGVSLPSGRVLLRTARSEIAGYLVNVPYRKTAGVTLYSRYPYWFVSALGVLLAVLLVRAHRSSSVTR